LHEADEASLLFTKAQDFVKIGEQVDDQVQAREAAKTDRKDLRKQQQQVPIELGHEHGNSKMVGVGFAATIIAKRARSSDISLRPNQRRYSTAITATPSIPPKSNEPQNPSKQGEIGGILASVPRFCFPARVHGVPRGIGRRPRIDVVRKLLESTLQRPREVLPCMRSGKDAAGVP
jgi:hypothetical protein